MELRHLRYFVTVADVLNVSRAAARLRVSQPTLSRQIQDLEAELGIKLFSRGPRRFRLTAEGEDLLWRCRDVLNDVEAVRQRAQALSTTEVGVLRVGASASTIENVLPAIVTRFKRLQRNVDLHVVQDAGAEGVLDRLERGDIDLAVTRFPKRPGLFGRPLFPLLVLAVAAASHPLRKRGRVNVADLANEPLLLPPRGFAPRELFREACRLSRVKPHVVLESDSPHSLIALAVAGVGVAIVPSTIARLTGERIKILPVIHDGSPLGTWMAVAWSAQHQLPSSAQTFIKVAVAYSRTSYPGKSLRLTPPLRPISSSDEVAPVVQASER